MMMSSSERSGGRAAGAARAALAGHVALIAFSTIALTTFLAGPPPPWLAEEPHATVMRWGWRLSGPMYVVLGAVAALLHATGRLGARRAVALFAAGSAISLGAELLGTATGVPFGGYSYTPLLGYRIAGLVPFPIPISWFYMIYGSLTICARLLPARDDQWGKLRWSLAAGAVLTAWDVAMDPAMVKTAHWVWHAEGFFYGMPLSNWLGWYLTGTVISRIMLAIVPPGEFAARVGPTSLPIWLYLANGIMPVAICVREGMWWAAVLGAAAMLVPAGVALAGTAPFRGPRRGSLGTARRGA